jgi:hypothetical protein
MKIEREKICIDLLFEKNLKEFLRKNGLYDKFIQGEIKCGKCGKTITKYNLGSIFVKNERVIFICNDPKCMENKA